MHSHYLHRTVIFLRQVQRRKTFLLPFPVHCRCWRWFCARTRGSVFQENEFPGGPFMLDNYVYSYFKTRFITKFYLLVNLQWNLHYLKPYKGIWKKIFTGTDGGLISIYTFFEILSMWITDLLKKKKKSLQWHEGGNKGNKDFTFRYDMDCPFYCFKFEM